MQIGNTVRILAPFSDSYPGEYQITEVVTYEDGQTVFMLGELGGFDPRYLELVP